MLRRHFFAALTGLTLAPKALSAAAVPDAVRYSHVCYGIRPCGSIGPYVEWRDRIWWIGERDELRWACIKPERWATKNDPAFDWFMIAPGLQSICQQDNVLWLHTHDGKWAQLTFSQLTFGDQQFIGDMTVRVIAHD